MADIELDERSPLVATDRQDRPTLAIVSTWQEVCGIAHYSALLKKALSSHFDITVLPAPRAVVSAGGPAAEERIRAIAEAAATFDHVNIQYEPGIYGPDVATVNRRIAAIVRAAKNVTITFHYLPRLARPASKAVLFGMLLRGRIFRTVRLLKAERAEHEAWQNLLDVMRAKAADGNLGIVVHQPADADYLRALVPGARIAETPLIYLDDAGRRDLYAKAKVSQLQERLPPRKLDETRYLGVFGFLQKSKGFETAIEALQFLPETYELLVFASLHPAAIPQYASHDPYLRKLTNLVAKKGLAPRVHFMGAQSDDDLLLGMMVCDAVLLPYRSTDQVASGPMGQALDLNRRVLATRNRTFVTVAHYRGPIFEFCDLGNPLEYAAKIPWVTKERTDRDVHGLRFVEYPPLPQRHTTQTTAAAYRFAMGTLAPGNAR